jgi:hypothetical protein
VLLAQGRFWRSSFTRSTGAIVFELRRAALPEELRKLLGGLLLDFARHKDRVSSAVSNDRLLAELRRVVLDATAVAVEEGVLAVVRAGDTDA